MAETPPLRPETQAFLDALRDRSAVLLFTTAMRIAETRQLIDATDQLLRLSRATLAAWQLVRPQVVEVTATPSKT